MADRTLPRWMSNEQHPEDKVDKQATQCKRNVLEPVLPFLTFEGTIIYSQERNDCSFLAEDLKSSLPSGSAVGFDLEWPPSFIKGKTKKVALVQICASLDKCHLFHLSSMSGFPTGLKMLLEDEKIKKVGVGVQGDMWKLMSDFDVKMHSFVELSDMANEKLQCEEKWSLDGLTKQLLRKQLLKDKGVRCSKWDDFELSEDQKRYAATDAYAGLMIYQKLNSIIHGSGKAQGYLKTKLSQLAKDIGDVAACIPEELRSTSRIEKLMEAMAQSLQAIKEETSKSHSSALFSQEITSPDADQAGEMENASSDTNKDGFSSSLTSTSTSPTSGPGVAPWRSPHPGRTSAVVAPDKTVVAPSVCENEGGPRQSTSGDYMMSLDISEYELQMIEMQARLEEMEEQSTLDFNAGKRNILNVSDTSCEVESDEDLESAMVQCVEEVEKQTKTSTLRNQRRCEDIITAAEEDEEEDVEEEEEEEGFDPSFPQPTAQQITCLKTYFGHHSFKPVQWKVIHSVLKERRDNLVVMATGYGKSLCFQYPPVLCGNVSVVISPLISLMEDQVLQLKMSNIPACFLGSAQTQNISADVRKGHFRVVYMTPEFCSVNITLLEHLNSTVGISLIAIDEAHCISQWGHDFRNAYRDLGKLKEALHHVPIVALTATASPSIRDDIITSLHLRDPLVTCTSFDRPNLYLDVNRKSGNIYQDFKPYLKKKPGGGHEFEGPVIVYCPSKKEAERVAGILARMEILCGVYHAGLGIKLRRETQHSFMRDEIQCVVATVAFGMGINKPDIRKVVHYGAPKEMESYYQEIGRAGRDGLPAACHVLWAPQDMALNRFLLSHTSEKMRALKMQMMAKMQTYLNSTRCRRKMILSHFEDKQLRKVTSGILGTPKCCDNCKNSAKLAVLSPSKQEVDQSKQDFGEGAFQLLGAIDSLQERFGVTVPILFLKGSTSQKIPEKYRRLPLFGAGKSVPDTWWKALWRSLVIDNYLMEASGQSKFTTLCKMTPKGRKWYHEAKDASKRTLLLQPNQDLRVRASASRPSTDTGSSRSRTPTVSESPMRGDSHSKNDPSVFVQRKEVTSRPPSQLAVAAISKPPPPSVSPREMELQAELYGKLVAERQKLASQKDIPPAILATNKILLDMAKTRPSCVTSLRQVEGVSEAKASMLEPLLHTIRLFCKTHGLQLKVSPSPAPSIPAQTCLSVGTATSTTTPASVPRALPEGIHATYRLFQQEGKTLRQVCDARSLPLSVVESHLLQAQSYNHPLDVERAGLTPALNSTITRIITSPPISSDLSDMRAIRARVPEEISTFLIRLTVSLLRTHQGATTSSQNALKEASWIEPQGKPPHVSKGHPHSAMETTPRPTTLASSLELSMPAFGSYCSRASTSSTTPSRPPAPGPALPGRPTSRATSPGPTPALGPTRPSQVLADVDEMDMSEDDLFSEMPMPEDDASWSDPKIVSTDAPLPSDPRPSVDALSSWNDEELDTDTQQLFADSPPPLPRQQNVGQHAKRKLPEWAEVPRAPVSSSTSKYTKRKKGLFM